MRPTVDREEVVREILSSPEPRKAAAELARRHGLDKGRVWSWTLEAARARAEQRVQRDGLMTRLLDSNERARLIAELQADGTTVLVNWFMEQLSRCDAKPEEIAALFRALPGDGSEDSVFRSLLYHPNVPDELLYGLLDQGRCISALGHRSGPRPLLERLASEHSYAEAITTLALHYYANDDYPLSDFVAFVRSHRDCFMLEYNLRRSPLLSEERRAAGLAAIQAPTHTE